MRIGIIADDYTGSADTGVQFAKKDLKTTIVQEHHRIRDAFVRSSVVVVDTESRSDSPEVAYEKVVSTIIEFQKAGCNLIYKKIDSTLRGNIGVELDAILDTQDVGTVVVCPAYPKAGRITIGGYHLVHQELIQNTEIAEDTEFPIKESHIPTLLRQQSRYQVSSIEIADVMEGKLPLMQAIKLHIADGDRILVIDAVSQHDLTTIASVMVDFESQVIICGSGGLAEELSDVIQDVSERTGNILIIAGSVRSVTAQQIARAQKQLKAHVIDIKVEQILTKNEHVMVEETRRISQEALKCYTKKKDVIIRWAESQKKAMEFFELGRLNKLEDQVIRARIGEILGQVTLKIMASIEIKGLILTGGETAFNVFKSMDVVEVRVDTEILPGIPLMQIVGGKFDKLPVITKAGAFGDSDALVQSILFLRNL
ncbi:MAG: four-carbon acid sugar kinase family protein [Candidatus Bathyarchaeota archaeon]|nr:four-carbon acid sugar kinase family protein [Candidatus Bathyarchaeota archaeon]